MTAAGHKQTSDAIVENIRRRGREVVRSEHTRAEVIPDDVRRVVDVIGPTVLELAERLDLSEAASAEIARAMTAQAEATAKALSAVLESIAAARAEDRAALERIHDTIMRLAPATYNAILEARGEK